jgi:hypothetical protein
MGTSWETWQIVLKEIVAYQAWCIGSPAKRVASQALSVLVANFWRSRDSPNQLSSEPDCRIYHNLPFLVQTSGINYSILLIIVIIKHIKLS